jgi:hypothetical protein
MVHYKLTTSLWRNRRGSTPKAWAATNLVTQRSSNYNQQNGSMNQPKGGVSKTPTANVKETNTPDRHANDRLLFLMANFLVCSPSLPIASCRRDRILYPY